MEEEEDDDIYAPDESGLPTPQAANGTAVKDGKPTEAIAEEDDSGEDIEEDDSDSDIDIITERKDEPKKEAAPLRPVNVKAPAPAPTPSPALEPAAALKREPTAPKTDTAAKKTHSKPGSSYPAVKTSNIDVDAKPVHEGTGKLITEVDMDADFPEDDKPWRRPGTDMTDYFNYGFDEFTWANYCLKQENLRKEVGDSKKQMDDMQSFLNNGMSGMPGMPGGNAGGAMPQMPGMGDIPPEMQQMFAQMMSSGMDPSQMDPSAFMQMMSGGQGGMPTDPSQNFGGQNFGQQHNQQQMAFNQGYNSGQGGRGRGRGHRW